MGKRRTLRYLMQSTNMCHILLIKSKWRLWMLHKLKPLNTWVYTFQNEGSFPVARDCLNKHVNVVESSLLSSFNPASPVRASLQKFPTCPSLSWISLSIWVGLLPQWLSWVWYSGLRISPATLICICSWLDGLVACIYHFYVKLSCF